MGVAYRARDPLLDREVAVKLIPPTMLNSETEQRFQHEAKPLFQVSADGGEPKQVTFQDPGEGMHRLPSFLPDGRRFVFARANKGLWSGSLDSRETKQIVPDNTMGVYANGRLLYLRNQSPLTPNY
ncbi:MAG TPA: hypothetical protein VGQ39_18160 [Pyrinomonadaceae bacterium]|jgi:hypothetical protein|nr:hypothetical protein [Pyrinomonadaceae bacterium]